MGAVKGDFARLRGLIARIKDLAGAGPLSRISQVMGTESLVLARKGFRSASDPYGSAWAPHAKGTRKNRILRRKGNLFRGFRLARANRHGFVIENTAPYASVHQDGAAYTAKGRVAFRTKKGRFRSTNIGRGRASKRQRGSVRVSVHRSHQIRIPQRMLFPISSRGLGAWETRLSKVAQRELSRILRGR